MLVHQRVSTNYFKVRNTGTRHLVRSQMFFFFFTKHTWWNSRCNLFKCHTRAHTHIYICMYTHIYVYIYITYSMFFFYGQTPFFEAIETIEVIYTIYIYIHDISWWSLATGGCGNLWWRAGSLAMGSKGNWSDDPEWSFAGEYSHSLLLVQPPVIIDVKGKSSIFFRFIVGKIIYKWWISHGHSHSHKFIFFPFICLLIFIWGIVLFIYHLYVKTWERKHIYKWYVTWLVKFPL